MAWHVFEKLLEGVANYSTFIGKLWITFFFIFRIIIVASIGDTVYSDEQSQFICNTLQPGCSNVCYNRFAPISQIRFWAVQILFVGMPSVMFVVYALHKMSNQRSEDENTETFNNQSHDSHGRGNVRRRRINEYHDGKNTSAKESSNQTSLPHYSDLSRQDHYQKSMTGVVKVQDSKQDPSYGDSLSSGRLPVHVVDMNSSTGKKKMKMKTVYNQDGKSEVMTTRSISIAYFSQTLLTIIIESLFLVLQHDMYKFEVKELFVCEGDPCPKKVDCYVSRPKEKTLFLLFMYVVSSLSILINLIEILYLAKRYVVKGKHAIRHNQYTSPRRHRHRARRIRAYPTIGPYPRRHGNSLTDTDNDDSIGSNYSFYER